MVKHNCYFKNYVLFNLINMNKKMNLKFYENLIAKKWDQNLMAKKE